MKLDLLCKCGNESTVVINDTTVTGLYAKFDLYFTFRCLSCNKFMTRKPWEISQ